MGTHLHTPHRTRTELVVAAATALAITLALPACSKTENGGTTTTGAAAGTTAKPASTTPSTGAGTTKATSVGSTAPGSTVDDGTGIDTMDDADTKDKSGTPADPTTAFLKDVRAARHEGYDRVVFEFANHVPGWAVGYKDKPILSDGAGEEVALKGTQAVVVRMESASGVDMSTPSGTSGYTEVYKGSKRIDPGTPEVAEVVQAGDFEAVLTWAIGTQEKVDFRVQVLEGPPRLVIDLRNH